jgi:ketosteroid isomerase-like protein
LPDGRISVDDRFGSGESVLAEGTLTGTHSGVFRTAQGEISASGNAVNVRYASVKRFRNGSLVSEHLYFDQLEFLQQLGAMKT